MKNNEEKLLEISNAINSERVLKHHQRLVFANSKRKAVMLEIANGVLYKIDEHDRCDD